MTDFVGVDISTDSASLLDVAIQNINATMSANGFPGWTAQDADLAVLIMGTIAEIAADNAVIASTLLDAAFRVFGTDLLGLPYNLGAPAMVSSTFAFTSPAPLGGYTIDTTTSVTIDGQAFYVADEVNTAAGATSLTVLLVAADVGTAHNGLGSIGAVVPLGNEIDWVQSVTLASATSGGVDQQDDVDYQNQLAGVLQLMAPRPIIADDYAAMVLSDYQLNATGITVGRASSIDNYYPAARTLGGGGTGPTPLTCAATTTSSVAAVSITTSPYPFAVPAVGAVVSGAGIVTNSTVLASPAPTATSFTMSSGATASGSATLTISAWTNVERCVTTFVTDPSGNALSNTQMDAISTWLQGFRETTFLAFVEPPTYTLVYVTCNLKVLQGYVAATVATTVESALISVLNPLTWGRRTGQATNSTWLNSSNGYQSIYYSVLVGVVMNTPGVQNVTSLTLGTTASPVSSNDLTLLGPAPLPTSNTTSIVINAS